MKYNKTQLIQELQCMDKPWIMLMIGPPGVGKSTILHALSEASIPFHTASTDNLLEAYGAKHGLSYSEAYGRANFKDIKRQMVGSMKAAFERRENVINDQTNMASKKRRTTLAEAPSDYIRIGLILNATNDELKARLAKREAETGKHVGWGVVENMFSSYSTPSKAEGFSYLWELK